MLVNGQWIADWQPVQTKDAKGGFVRQTSSFRHWITPDGSPGPTGEGGFKTEAGRYHLYVALICPWASRTLIARRLKGLEQAISVSVVEPTLTDQGWRFGGYPGSNRDALDGAGFATTQEAYEEAFGEVFGMLDELGERLDGRAFLFGDRLSENAGRADPGNEFVRDNDRRQPLLT